MPYLHLILYNHDFRRIWLAQVVSYLGDWLSTIALMHVLVSTTGSPVHLSLLLVIRSTVSVALAPAAGALADRLDRKRVMVVSDVVRAVMVLGYSVVTDTERLTFLFVAAALHSLCTALFEAARTAAVPRVVAGKELMAANALSALTWSVLASVGAGLGGLATTVLGPRWVFPLDSVTFLFSAYQLSQIRAQTNPPQQPKRAHDVRADIEDLIRGFLYLGHHTSLCWVVGAKAAWSLGGGGLVLLLTVIGEKLAERGALGIGLLYAARGLGTALGPVLAQKYLPDEDKWFRWLGYLILLSGIMYVPVAVSNSMIVISVLVFLAHAASGASWVLSTVLLQRQTPNEFLGRVAAVERLLWVVTEMVSQLVASYALDTGWLPVSGVVSVLAGVLVLLGTVWALGSGRANLGSFA